MLVTCTKEALCSSNFQRHWRGLSPLKHQHLVVDPCTIYTSLHRSACISLLFRGRNRWSTSSWSFFPLSYQSASWPPLPGNSVVSGWFLCRSILFVVVFPRRPKLWPILTTFNCNFSGMIILSCLKITSSFGGGLGRLCLHTVYIKSWSLMPKWSGPLFT